MSLPELSLTEQRIATLAATGKTIPEIAASVALDEPTVRWHLVRALQKLEQAARLHDRIASLRSALGPR